MMFCSLPAWYFLVDDGMAETSAIYQEPIRALFRSVTVSTVAGRRCGLWRGGAGLMFLDESLDQVLVPLLASLPLDGVQSPLGEGLKEGLVDESHSSGGELCFPPGKQLCLLHRPSCALPASDVAFVVPGLVS